MSWFIKTERFTPKTMGLSPEKRNQFLNKHRNWVIKLNKCGTKVSSGYLINEGKFPGGGGLMFIEAHSFKEAKLIIETDTMIISGLVTWNLQEWVPFAGELMESLNVEIFS